MESLSRPINWRNYCSVKMRNIWLISVCLALIAAPSGTAGCDAPPANQSNFNLIFRYGVGVGNELNTFNGTYTRDMVMDPTITVNLSLSEEELDIIYQKMLEIHFFDYPDEFSVSTAAGSFAIMTPYSSYYFRVEYNSSVKELRWKDEIINPDEKADRLKELIKLIRDIIESKEEYKSLPEPTGGYM